MEIDIQTYNFLMNTDDYVPIWQGKPSREMKLRGWTDDLFIRLLGPCLYECSSYPDEPICSKVALWAGENSIDLAARQVVLAKRRRKRERARLKVMKANGYQGSALSEISGRYNLIRKEVPKLMRHAESFMRVYSLLLPDASYWLTGIFARGGFFDRDYPSRRMRPGERRFSEPSLFISTSLDVGKQVRVKVTSRGVYLPHTRKVTKHGMQLERTGFKRTCIEKPASVISAFEKAGVKINAHDTAAIYETISKQSRKRARKPRPSRIKQRMRRISQ